MFAFGDAHDRYAFAFGEVSVAEFRLAEAEENYKIILPKIELQMHELTGDENYSAKRAFVAGQNKCVIIALPVSQNVARTTPLGWTGCLYRILQHCIWEHGVMGIAAPSVLMDDAPYVGKQVSFGSHFQDAMSLG